MFCELYEFRILSTTFDMIPFSLSLTRFCHYFFFLIIVGFLFLRYISLSLFLLTSKEYSSLRSLFSRPFVEVSWLFFQLNLKTLVVLWKVFLRLYEKVCMSYTFLNSDRLTISFRKSVFYLLCFNDTLRCVDLLLVTFIDVPF